MTTSPAPTPRATSAPAIRADRSATSPKVSSRRSPSRPIATRASRDGIGRVDELAHEAHSGADQRSPRLSRSSPSQAKSIAISTSSARGVSGWSVHQLAID